MKPPLSVAMEVLEEFTSRREAEMLAGRNTIVSGVRLGDSALWLRVIAGAIERDRAAR